MRPQFFFFLALFRALWPLIFFLRNDDAIDDLMPGMSFFLINAAGSLSMMNLAMLFRRQDVRWAAQRRGHQFRGFDDDVLLVQMDMPRRPNVLQVWMEADLDLGIEV